MKLFLIVVTCVFVAGCNTLPAIGPAAESTVERDCGFLPDSVLTAARNSMQSSKDSGVSYEANLADILDGCQDYSDPDTATACTCSMAILNEVYGR